MSDWFGLTFFVLLIAGIVVGLKILSKPQKRTAEDFERNIAEGGSGLSASVNALQEILDPAEARAKEVKVQLKEGRYSRKQREGKADGELEDEKND